MSTKFATLDELYDAMMTSDPHTLNKHGQWRSDLPVFGAGEEDTPTGDQCWLENTYCVWSWDDARMIIGHSSDDLEIIPRAKGETHA